MSKRGRRLKRRDNEVDHSPKGGGPERHSGSWRQFDPNYNRVPYGQDTWAGKMARTYNEDTVAHYDITRKSRSNGTGHLPQPVRTETTPSQQALRDLLQGKERTLEPLSPPGLVQTRLPEPDSIPPEGNLSEAQNSTDIDEIPYIKGPFRIVEL